MRSEFKRKKNKKETGETEDVKTTDKITCSANTVTHSTRCKALRIWIKGNSRLGRRSMKAFQLEGVIG